MTAADTLPVGRDVAQWPLWGTTARLVVTEPRALRQARHLVEDTLAEVELACSRFRPDSELSRLTGHGGEWVRISPLLAELVAASLRAAAVSDGAVDPTMGRELAALGYHTDLSRVDVHADGAPVAIRPAAGPRRVRLDGLRLRLPAAVGLDLGATGKAFAADRCARLVHARLGVGVLVSLGGDIATAGERPGGWHVLVRDQPADPAVTVALPAGAAIATSSTVSRTWRRGGRTLHHVLDPRTCHPVPRIWRSVTVAAADCVTANTHSTAALVHGRHAEARLAEAGVSARLLAADGSVRTVGGWPAERER